MTLLSISMVCTSPGNTIQYNIKQNHNNKYLSLLCATVLNEDKSPQVNFRETVLCRTIHSHRNNTKKNFVTAQTRHKNMENDDKERAAKPKTTFIKRETRITCAVNLSQSWQFQQEQRVTEHP